jgi:hypothetical protein
VEHLVGLRLLDKLKHAALVAEGRRKLEVIFARDFFVAKKAISNRHTAERHESGDLCIAYAATAGKVVLGLGHRVGI